MSQIELMVVVWIATMIAVGVAFQRMAYWKTKNKYNHDLLDSVMAVLATMDATEDTWRVIEALHKTDRPHIHLERIQ